MDGTGVYTTRGRSMERRISIRRPLMIYATVFMLLSTFIVVTLANFSLVTASRRAYRRALADEMRAIAHDRTPQAIRSALAERPPSTAAQLTVVTSTGPGGELAVTEARIAASNPDVSSSLVAEPIERAGSEAYLVARIDPSIAVSIAVVQIIRLIPFVLFAAIGCAALLTVMIGRLLVPSLSRLKAIAKDPNIPQETFVTEDAPNEFLDVAHAFRRTIRQLAEEREHIAAQHRELERMHADLVRASKLASVGRLAAGIAHEIGNPLAAVQGYLDLLPRLDPSEQAEVIARSAKELKRIHEIIRKLLTYARQDEPKEPPKPISTKDVVSDAILLVRGHPAMRGIEIEHAASDEAHPDALGHPVRLGQVMVNLLLNAAQAMQGLPSPRIEIERVLEGDRVEVRVRDVGPGIASDKIEQIFDPFFTTKAPGEGTGLGLAVSRSLVESMDGDLVVSSTAGQGACFTIRLKRA